MERTIKEKLSEFFHDVVQVQEAYFARVLYSGNIQDVAVCVYGTPEMDAQLVLRGIQQVYTRAVNTEQGIHTIILNPGQRVEIAKGCKSFYRSRVLQ